jgi:hypothetical protein
VEIGRSEDPGQPWGTKENVSETVS